MHQGSVLSPLLFAIVMDVVSRETRSGLPWELLYADDLVLIATTRAELCMKLQAWRGCLVGKGLKVNAEKSKVMVTDGVSGVMSETGAWPCGVCGKGVAANSLQCTGCRKWVHRMCSGVRGSLQTASETFVCKRCKGDVPQVEVEDDVVVEGETYEVVEKFCYLGDMLSRGGGVDAAVTARVRSAWAKFRELAPFLTSKATPRKMKGQVYTACVRSCLIYGAETWATKVEHDMKLERTEMRMIRWMCGVSLRERRTSVELRQRLGVEPIGEVVRRNRLRWFGHVERKDDADWVKNCTKLVVEGSVPPGRPRMTWQSAVSNDMRLLGVNRRDAKDRSKWRSAIRRTRAHPATPGNPP